MKSTDYAPRAAAMDVYIMGRSDLTGAEIGVDVGAHAEALLSYCDIKHLHLIDIWMKDYYKGYCEGRLARFGGRFTTYHLDSVIAAKDFTIDSLDFIYFDQQHDYDSVKSDLVLWWPKLRKGGISGYRNYSESNAGLKKAIDEFVLSSGIKNVIDKYHHEIIMFK